MRYSGLTDQGKTRESNQDTYNVCENDRGDLLAIVCDGVGGASHGEVASSLAIKHMLSKFEDNEDFLDLEDAKAWLYTSIVSTNDLVYKKAQKTSEYKGMGTTLVALLKCKYGTLVANVGDSRAYALYKNRSMRAITSDHTYVANLVQLGQISIQEALHHPQRHVITNAIGIWKAIEVDIFDVEESVQSVLLCSDGLHGYVDERLINNVLKDQRLHIHTKTQRLVQAANDAGGYDNVTVIVVDLNGGESHDE